MHSEITEVGGGGNPNDEAHKTDSGKKRKAESLNAKIKQFFRKRTELKPFYSGGKISVLSECHFACQCGPAVNLISTRAKIKGKDEPEPVNEEEEDNSLEISNEERVKVEDAECFQIISHLESELDEIIAFDACPSTHLVVTSHKSSLLRVWDVNKNELIKTVKSLHNLPIGLIEIHKVRANHFLQRKLKPPSGRASPAAIRGSEEIQEVPTYEAATLSTRGELVWVTVSGATLKIWDFGGNQVSKAVQIGNIASVGFAKWEDTEAKRLFVAERNIYVIQSDANRDSEMQYRITQTLEGHYSQVTGIEFALGGSMMISGGRDKVLILWQRDDSNDGLFKRLKTIPMPESIESLVLTSPSDLYIALSPHDVRHYNVSKNSLSNSSVLNQSLDETITALYAPLKSLENSEREFFIATTHSSAIFQLEPKNEDMRLEVTKQYVGCLDEVLCVVFWTSPDEIVVANNTNVIKVYDLSTGHCKFLRGHKDIVLSLNVKKEWLVSGSKDNSIILWNKMSDKPCSVLEGHLSSVTAVCFSPINQHLYSVSEDNFLKLWDSKLGKCLKSQPAHEKEIHTVHCSPNSSLLITSSREKTAKVWDAETLDLVGILKGHKKSVWDARFSSWDQLAATSSADTTIKIWNLVSFNCIQTLQGHLSSVLQAMFVNLGLQICSSSSDGTMRLWDLKTSACVTTEECGNDKIWSIAAQPDLSVIVAGSADSIITVWDDITEEKVQEVNEKRRRFLQDEQKLSNVMRSCKWEEAFKLAVELDRPFTLLKIVRELGEPIKDLTPIVKSLTLDLKTQLLDYIKKWNTNTKTSTEAQYLLNVLFKTTPFNLLEKDMPTEAIIAYTQKHFNRLKTHRERVSIIQYFANKDQIVE